MNKNLTSGLFDANEIVGALVLPWHSIETTVKDDNGPNVTGSYRSQAH